MNSTLNGSFAPISSQTQRKRETLLETYSQEILSENELKDKLDLLRTKLDAVRKDSTSSKLKTLKQKTEAKESCAVLLDNVCASVFTGNAEGIYPLCDILHDLVCATQDELSENEEKQEKIDNSSKRCSGSLTFIITDNCVKFVKALLKKDIVHSDKFHIVELAIILQKCVFNERDGSLVEKSPIATRKANKSQKDVFGSKSKKRGQYNYYFTPNAPLLLLICCNSKRSATYQKKKRFELSTRQILFDYACCVPVILWEPQNVIKLFKISRKKLSLRLCEKNLKRAEHWARILLFIFEHIKSTCLYCDPRNNVVAIIEEIANYTDSDIWSRRLSCSAVIFDMFSYVIDEFGIEYRSIIVKCILPIAINSCEQLNGIWSSTLASSEKNAIENSCSSLWGFLDRLSALVCPGGILSETLSDLNISKMAEKALPYIINDIKKSCSSNARLPFELPESRVCLIARLLCISELAPNNIGNEYIVKRSRESLPTDKFCEFDWNNVSPSPSLISLNLRIILVLFSKYSRRIPQWRMKHLATMLWANREKFLSHCDVLCDILSECLIFLDSDTVCESLVPWVLSEGSGESAAAVVVNIMRKDMTLLSEVESWVPQVFELIARGKIFGRNIDALIQEVMIKCDVNEVSTAFNTSSHKNDDKTNKWRLRSDIINWILYNSEYNSDCDALLEMMLMYYPRKKDIAITSPQRNFETDILSFLMINEKGHIQFNSTRDEIYFPDILITHLLEFTVKTFRKSWDRAESIPVRRIWLWRQALLLDIRLDKIIRTSDSLQQFREEADSWLADQVPSLTNYQLKLVGIGILIDKLGSCLQEQLILRALENPYAGAIVIRCDTFITEDAQAVLDICLVHNQMDCGFLNGTSRLLAHLFKDADIYTWITFSNNYSSLMSDEMKSEIITEIGNALHDPGQLDQLGPQKDVFEKLLNELTVMFAQSSSLTADILQSANIVELSKIIDQLDLSEVLFRFTDMLDCSILSPKIVSLFLTSPAIWQSHIEVLYAVFSNDQVLKTCFEFVSNFSKIVSFHSAALIGRLEHYPNINELSSLRHLENEQFIEWTRSHRNEVVHNDEMGVGCFPTAFRAHNDDWPYLCNSFISLLPRYPFDMLAWLRSEGLCFCDRRENVRWITLLECLSCQFQKSAFARDHHFSFPFISVLSSSIVLVFDTAVKRHASRQEMAMIVAQWKKICDTLVDMPESLSLRISEIVAKYRGSDTSCFEESIMELVETFLNGDWIDENVLMMSSFWTLAAKILKEKDYECVAESTLDHIHLIWEWVPHLRECMTHISAALTVKFGGPSSYSLKFSGSDSEFLSYLKRFCKVIFTNERENQFDVVRFALRLLSCDQFGEDSLFRTDLNDDEEYGEIERMDSQLLSQVETEVVLNVDPTDVVDVCGKILRLLDVSNAVIRTLAKNIVNCPSICLTLCPILCALDRQSSLHLIIKCSQWYTKDPPVRVVRCLAECLDCIGVSVLSHPNIIKAYADKFHTLSSVLIRAKYFKHAELLFNLHADSVVDFDRGCASFSSLHPLASHDLSCELSASLHCSTGNARSLIALPAKYQMSQTARIVLLSEKHDWLRIVIDGKNSDFAEVWEARYACGLEASQQELQGDLLYRDAWKLGKWNDVSFPKSKKFSSVDSAYFSLLSLERESCAMNMVKDTASVFGQIFEKKLCVEHVVNIESASRLLHFKEFESDNLRHCFIQQPSFLCTSHSLACVRARVALDRTLSHRERVQLIKDGYDVIALHITTLMSQKKFMPALKMLSNWQSICEESGVSAVRARCVLKKISILTKIGDMLQAEGELNFLLEQPSCSETQMLTLCELSKLKMAQGNGMDALQHIFKAREQCIRDRSISREGRATAHRLLYKIASSQLSDIEGSRESRGFRMKKEAILDWTKQISELKRKNSELAVRRRLEMELKCEEEDVKKMDVSVLKSAELALDAGLFALEYSGDDAPQILFPVIDILFRYGENIENVETEANERIVEILNTHIRILDCSKWLPAARHICGHSFKNTALGNAIRKIMVRLMVAYPFHVVNTVLFYDDGQIKSPIVLEMLRSACGESSELKQIIKDIRHGHRIYKNFGQMDLGKSSEFRKIKCNDKNYYEMNSKSELANRLQDLLNNLPLPVIEHNVGIPKDYSRDNFVKWGKIDPNCERADGLSTPTVLTVIGSNGKKYKTIWKKEDVRQDCLVEQIFAVVNTLIGERSEPHPLRTYKVEPLDERTGIIEWCMGTRSLKEILCGENREGGLHREVNPNDITAREAIVTMSKCKLEDKMRVFDQICQLFRPVFRHFFYQNYSSASEWSTKISAYTKSLAQWSIVCYMIGLGDRHTSNILFEPATAKFVHIDLGMILEYSRRSLPVPELVPFRMTRDIVDPILCDGLGGKVEGIATETVCSLRKHREVILGLASVFVRETVTSLKEASGGRSFMSETAISRLRDKLSGLDTTVTEQTPNAQARRLIKEATDKENLSRIFHGWMPFM